VLTLSIILCELADGSVLARGIIQDVTVFEHVTFASLDELAKYASIHWLPKYTVRTTWTGARRAA
jgi:hypothetical protein